MMTPNEHRMDDELPDPEDAGQHDEHLEARIRAERDGLERGQFWRELGLEPPQWEDEATAPPVDEEALRSYLRRELGEADVRRIGSFIWRFRSWAAALVNVTRTESPSDRG